MPPPLAGEASCTSGGSPWWNSRLPCKGSWILKSVLSAFQKTEGLIRRLVCTIAASPHPTSSTGKAVSSATFPAGEGDPLPSVPGKHLLRRRPLTCQRHASLVKHADANTKCFAVDFVRNLASLITSHSPQRGAMRRTLHFHYSLKLLCRFCRMQRKGRQSRL